MTEPDQVSESKYEDQITTDSESSAESEIQETESLLIQEPVSQETESLVSPKLKADLRKISQKVEKIVACSKLNLKVYFMYFHNHSPYIQYGTAVEPSFTFQVETYGVSNMV